MKNLFLKWGTGTACHLRKEWNGDVWVLSGVNYWHIANEGGKLAKQCMELLKGR